MSAIFRGFRSDDREWKRSWVLSLGSEAMRRREFPCIVGVAATLPFAAKALGVNVSPALLSLADKVIE